MLGQYSSGGSGGGGVSGVFVIIYLAVVVLYIAGIWKTFVKAGQPGWAAIVPLYNIWILVKIAGKPGWWFVLAFIPIVGILLISIAVAENFGKSAGFGVGLGLLGFIFYPILGFGDAQYRGGVAGIPPAPPMPA